MRSWLVFPAADKTVRGPATAVRYAVGLTPKMLRKRALNVDRSPNPLSSAIDRTLSDELARDEAARRILAASKYWYGVIPIARRKTRRK